MISFSNYDIIILIGFFLILVIVGLIPAIKDKNSKGEFLLAGRKMGLTLFVMTNVSTWYGGILGIGEFTYNYGLISWTTQGLPYYFFAILFAFFLAKKVRKSNLHTIPEKIKQIYGVKASIISAIYIFFLASPAPYLLMSANIFEIIFGLNKYYAVFISAIVAVLFVIKGGYKSDLFTDVFQFFVMFLGFIAIVYFSYEKFSGLEYLVQRLPSNHLNPTGGFSIYYLITWFIIAFWTFADPGFHQRCYSVKNEKIAFKGILISVFFWILFDFLTTSTGLYSKAYFGDSIDAILSFPLYANAILSSGWKGLFFAGLFATIYSTLNSFLFISSSTLINDIAPHLKILKIYKKSFVTKTRYTIILTALLSVIIVLFSESVVQLWYILGSLFIPGLLFLIIAAYYPKLKISIQLSELQLIMGFLVSLMIFILKTIGIEIFRDIEPLLIGLLVVALIQMFGHYKRLGN
ncbi:MAG: sodium:solute symporter family protein [Ignavibacteriaceae bacterium]|jgi:SSS family solute:Na+ symporter|nr:sodium:solute symporter family protein [Ignavibacteriaceae bacterium]